MEIIKINGYELEKTFPTTSEDFFNQSEVTIKLDRKEHTFSVLYVRSFEAALSELTAYQSDPIYTNEDHQLFFRDIVALCILLKNPSYINRKRLYISDQEVLKESLKGIRFAKLNEILPMLAQSKPCTIDSPENFVRSKGSNAL